MPPTNIVTEGDCWLASSLLVNELPVREYNQMLHPLFQALPFPIFLIADERKRVTLRLELANEGPPVFTPVEIAGDLDGVGTPVQLELYGNLLLKTGVPIEFEIANPIGGGQL